MQGGVSGFQNAPVTRAVVVASGLLSVVFSAQRRARALGISYQDTITNFRLWKIFPSVFAFQSTPELMFGLYLLYYFRVFERQIGSNKYSVFCLFTITASSLLEILSLVILKDTNYISTLASGPYGLIFASFVPFFLDIPITSRFRIFGLNFSDKSFIYLAGFQLLLSSWKRSLIPGIFGLVAGSLYRLNVLGIRKMKYYNCECIYFSFLFGVIKFLPLVQLPQVISSFFARYFAPSPGSTSRPSRSLVGNTPSHRGRAVQNQPSTGFAPIVEPPESSVAMLVSMGFDGNNARQALVRARNDINVATNILLEAQSH
ncbi:Rhomboid-like protein 20 [Zea mays]|uniref:Rhomboid-like protein 20 n=1 Tax=Zea mays TaxID=4577 RepID=A0A1D6MQK4_MAIZE|nr:Rhomboid-like protein 20 [Zea mays]